MHTLSKREELIESLYSVEEDGELPLIDTLEDKSIAAPEETLSLQQMRNHLHAALAMLTERERQVLLLRYGLESSEGCPYAQVARQLSISTTRVRQIEAGALQKLRSSSESAALIDYWMVQGA